MNDSNQRDEIHAESIDEAVERALGDSQPAHEWKRLISALEDRLTRLQRSLQEAGEGERLLLRAQIEETSEQIAVLREEAAIAGFIEGTVRFSHQVRRLNEG